MGRGIKTIPRSNHSKPLLRSEIPGSAPSMVYICDTSHYEQSLLWTSILHLVWSFILTTSDQMWQNLNFFSVKLHRSFLLKVSSSKCKWATFYNIYIIMTSHCENSTDMVFYTSTSNLMNIRVQTSPFNTYVDRRQLPKKALIT